MTAVHCHFGCHRVSDNHEAFEILRRIGNSLVKSLEDNTWIPTQKMMAMRKHITLCDSLEKSRLQLFIFLVAVENWNRCYKRWLEFKPPGENNIEMSGLFVKTQKAHGWKDNKPRTKALMKIEQPPAESAEPRKKWEDVITPDDEVFLKSLHVRKKDDEDPDPA